MEPISRVGIFARGDNHFFCETRPLAECEEQDGFIRYDADFSEMLRAKGYEEDAGFSRGYVVWDCLKNKAVVYMDKSIRNANMFAWLEKHFKITDYELAETEADKQREAEAELAARYDAICEALHDVLTRNDEENFFDAGKCMRALFDAYHYFRDLLKTDKCMKDITVDRIPLIGMLGAVGYLSMNLSPEGCTDKEYVGCRELARNLMAEIMDGFCGYYRDTDMIISRFVHIPAGCSELTVDMSDFDKMYDELIDYMGWYFGEDSSDEEWDEEEDEGEKKDEESEE